MDEVGARAIQFDQRNRPDSVAELRELLRFHSNQFETQQELSRLARAVVPRSELNDPLTENPPKIVGADYDGQFLVLTLDQPVNQEWVQALLNMGSYAAAANAGPEHFALRGNEAKVPASESNAQQIIGCFKSWLPQATVRYRQNKIRAQQEEEQRKRDALNREKEELERRQRVRSSLKF